MLLWELLRTLWIDRWKNNEFSVLRREFNFKNGWSGVKREAEVCFPSSTLVAGHQEPLQNKFAERSNCKKAFPFILKRFSSLFKVFLKSARVQVKAKWNKLCSYNLWHFLFGVCQPFVNPRTQKPRSSLWKLNFKTQKSEVELHDQKLKTNFHFNWVNETNFWNINLRANICKISLPQSPGK